MFTVGASRIIVGQYLVFYQHYCAFIKNFAGSFIIVVIVVIIKVAVLESQPKIYGYVEIIDFLK